MIIGYGTSHDAGVAAVDPDTGYPIFAATLERLTRHKNDQGNPLALTNWLHDATGIALLPTRELPLADDQQFPYEAGFHALEQSAHQSPFPYRWTAAEATVHLPESWQSYGIKIRVANVAISHRTFSFRVFLNGHETNPTKIGNEWVATISRDQPPLTTIKILCDSPFSSPPDSRVLGIMITGISALLPPTSVASPDNQAADRLPTIPSLTRLIKKHFLGLPRLNLRSYTPRRLLVHTVDTIRYPVSRALHPANPRTTYDHHLCHAATAYYPSGFQRALVVTLDGMGDWYSARVMRGEDGRLTPIEAFYYEQMPTGLNYEVVTAMLGFNPQRHAGKVTGLAAFGKRNDACATALNAFFTETWQRGGRADRSYESFMRSRNNTGHDRLREIRETEFGKFTREDIAYAIQKRTETEVCDWISKYKARFPELTNICVTGGVFANVRVNQEVKRLGFERIFVQPAMSDAGLCYGAALLECAKRHGGALLPYELRDVFLGPEYSNEFIAAEIQRHGLTATYIEETQIGTAIAAEIAARKVVAHFHGRMEFGPRALGNRSILYSAADPDVNRWLNDQLKRTEFMPFAPAILAENATDYFLETQGAEHAAEFMTITFDCTQRAKAEIPAAVHVDGTARPQFVRQDRNPRFHAILKAYHALTGVPVTINTSFNMHEEPIVATPSDAIRSFQQGNLAVLVLGNYIISAKQS